MVVNFPIAAKLRAMCSSRWLPKGVIFLFFLVVVLVEESIGKNIKDVDDDETIIDNIKRVYGDYEQHIVPPHLDLKGYGGQRSHRVIEKIPFAVSPRDYRFHLSPEALRGEPEELAPGLIDNDYSYQARPEEFVNLNPPYYSYNQYPRKFHSKHVPFVDYNQNDYNILNHDLNGLHPHIPNAYHDPDSPSYQGYQDIVDRPNQAFDSLHGPPNQKEIHTSQPESVNFYKQESHFAPQPGYNFLERNGNHGEAISDFYFLAIVIGCTVASISIVVGAGICYYKLSKSKREAADAEYPAYGVTGPSKDVSPGAADRKLVQSAHMYHYQHQKQQMIASEKSGGDDRHCSASDVDSEEDEEVPDYTVYECPGLAPTDNMEVKNPLFSDDPTPATPAAAPTDTSKDTKDTPE